MNNRSCCGAAILFLDGDAVNNETRAFDHLQYFETPVLAPKKQTDDPAAGQRLRPRYQQ
jgi:hypothetical protein